MFIIVIIIIACVYYLYYPSLRWKWSFYRNNWYHNYRMESFFSFNLIIIIFDYLKNQKPLPHSTKYTEDGVAVNAE